MTFKGRAKFITPEEREKSKVLGRILRNKRKSACFKLNYVAHQMRISPAMLSALETGRRIWNHEHIRRFQAAIGITPTNNTKGKHARKEQ